MFEPLFVFITLYFRPSRMLPIDPACRELQNAIGEIEIGDFQFFDVLWSLMVQEASLMLLDSL